MGENWNDTASYGSALSAQWTYQRADVQTPAADEWKDTNFHDNQQFDLDHHITQAYDPSESETTVENTSKHFNDGTR